MIGGVSREREREKNLTFDGILKLFQITHNENEPKT